MISTALSFLGSLVKDDNKGTIHEITRTSLELTSWIGLFVFLFRSWIGGWLYVGREAEGSSSHFHRCSHS
jgi:hypothetical protein